jgi:hypothetical protein
VPNPSGDAEYVLVTTPSGAKTAVHSERANICSWGTEGHHVVRYHLLPSGKRPGSQGKSIR